MDSTAPDTSTARPPSAQRNWASIAAYWGVVVMWMGVISGLSGEPFSAQNTNRYIDPVLHYLFPNLSQRGILLAHTVIRKSAHFTEFFILGSLAFWASRRGRPTRWHWRWTAQSLALAVAWALLDEAHQAFVVNRTASLADSGIDSLGAATSQLVVYVRHRWRG